ncbi:hypothetical protein P9597_30280 [Aneurinibacillus migulanus]|nr:hypothetical protein [Aneurinibacillus migulanus]
MERQNDNVFVHFFAITEMNLNLLKKVNE